MSTVSTGLKGLDEIVQNLRLGDNVVWQVDDVSDYRHFVDPYVEKSLKDKRNLVYIRFARHEPLIKDNKWVKVYHVDANSGFETFTKEVHEIIAKEGLGAFYVFDCLSDLLSAWATDLMIGNFFMVTCPYLFKLDTIAYFSILRDQHSFKTIARIRETTQLLLDVYDFEDEFYVQPLKVWKRYSPTMFLPHVEEKDKFVPITSSVDATKLFSYISQKGAETAERNLDYWDRLFLDAEELSRKPGEKHNKKEMLECLDKFMLGREARMLSLIKEYLTLEDLLAIKARMVGTGFIGGKALGMLLARKILTRDKSFDWKKVLEPHDSFYIGSDLFYTYIVENGWWELWLEQKTEKGYFSKAVELRDNILRGKFPHEVREQFRQIIEYFGQSPIIVRSSSLLEDAFGNAFAGKYESIFDVNQGSPEERYQRFEDIVRQVYASTMNEDALDYRLQRGLSQQDEQMALLVQRVSGTHQQKSFFPFMAGVGFSYNTFVWHKDMDPKAGMLRLVFGLGTRAVNRVEGDYPRIVALDQPQLRPYRGMEKAKRFSQHDVDILNIEANQLQTVALQKLLEMEPKLKLDLIGQRDQEAEQKMKELKLKGQSWVLTFDQLLSKTDFSRTMQRILKTLEAAYQYPVDVEFTVNFGREGKSQINLVQCRPLQAKGEVAQVKIPKNIPKSKLLFSSEGNFMGGSVSQSIERLIYVDTEAYRELLMTKKFEVARIIGRLNKLGKGRTTLLIGPGRWGSRDASLGVPVNFAEINNVTALVEVDDPEGGFMPELSFGSHFFLDLVETNIFYAALFMGNEDVVFDKKWLDGLANKLGKLIPEAKDYESVVRVHDFKKEVKLLSDVTSQRVVCLK
ncbi:MAG: PEP/pyruvate-binding domain-containing protein [Candidatus Margulisiibacteriota bacterium]